MIDHTSVGVGDYKVGKAFYEKALAPLGYTLGADMAEYKVCGFACEGVTDFWVAQPEVGKPLGSVHVAFKAKDEVMVKAFYDAALAAGGTDNGAPGIRKEYSPGYYAAFVHDPYGNNIEAVAHVSQS